MSCSLVLETAGESSKVMLERTKKLSGGLGRKKSMRGGFGSLMRDQLMGDGRKPWEGKSLGETHLSRDGC